MSKYEKKKEKKTEKKFVYNTSKTYIGRNGKIVATKASRKELGATLGFVDDLSNKCYTESLGVISGFRPLVEWRHFYDAWLSFIHWGTVAK